MIRLIAIDIDGTLLDSRGRLPEAHRDALAEAHRHGIAIALVTGRSFHFALPVVRSIGVPAALVCNNGALVKDEDGETAMRRLLPRSAARSLLAATPGYEDSVAIIFDRPDERQMVFERMDWSHPNRSGYFEKNKAFIAKSAVPLADALTEDPIQVMFNGGVAAMRALIASLRALPVAAECAIAVTEYERLGAHVRKGLSKRDAAKIFPVDQPLPTPKTISISTAPDARKDRRWRSGPSAAVSLETT